MQYLISLKEVCFKMDFFLRNTYNKKRIINRRLTVLKWDWIIEKTVTQTTNPHNKLINKEK